MPLDEVGRRYADALFNNRREDILQNKKSELEKIHLDHTQRNTLMSGAYIAAHGKVFSEQIRLLSEARAETLVNAYQKSGLPFDDKAYHDIKDEVMQFCHNQQHHVIGALGQIITQTFQGTQPSGMYQAVADEIVRDVGVIMGRLDRDLSIRRDEVILEETRTKKAYAAGLGKRWDVFICHATEDKDEFVRPLAEALGESGLSVWYDELTLKIGDSIRRKIEEGLGKSRYGIVVLSRNFFAKNWPQNELDGLASKEVVGSGTKVILPVWHAISLEEVRERAPMLSGRLAAKSSDGVASVVRQLREAMGL